VTKPWPHGSQPVIQCLQVILKAVHTGDYSRRFLRQFVAENGDCRTFLHQCGEGFSGCYLLGVDDYRVVGGSRRWGTSCTYDFFSTDDVASGRFFSEKFPQNYPASLSCSYLFVASADQVITVTFSSLRLASGHHQHLHHQQQEQQDVDDSRSV